MKYGIRYIPHIGRLYDTDARFFRAIKNTNLAQVSKIELMFDPFLGKRAESLRLFAFHVDTPKLRQTNFKCSVKLNVVCDRSEPQMNLKFNNGDKALFKTSNLTAIEIAEEFNVICEIHNKRVAEEESKKRRR